MKSFISNSGFYFMFLLLISFNTKAQFHVANIFSDNMVLQRNTPIPIWGWADVNEKIEIKFNQQQKNIIADADGKWKILLDAEKEGGPYDLIIKGKNTITFKNILVGDVWLCSGQSNMEWTVGQSDNAKNEIANANFPLIRHIKIEHVISSLPENNFKTDGWEVCNSATVADFTGVGYFFAKNILAETNIPIGLINDCWGGTNIETWISRDAFERSDEYKEMIKGMPIINLDSLAKLTVGSIKLRIEKLQGAELGEANVKSFKEISFDDSKLPIMNVPQMWEEQALGEIDGVVWLRKTFELSKEDVNKKAILSLAKIDDEDITYINGVKIGSTNKWDADRNYQIPDGILKEGKNVIAIRVLDTGGGGGIYGDATNVKLDLGNKIIPLSGEWKFQVESIIKTPNVNSMPSLAYNAMINPILPMSIKGVLWYQGESNASRAYQYRKAFPLLIKDWREKFNNTNMPFYFVQLASYSSKNDIRSFEDNDGSCPWAELREAQTMTLSLPNTGMCVTTDLVTDPKDIHPTNKQDVGKRLAAIALKNIYNKKMISSSPLYKSMKIVGNKIILTFSNVNTGLMTTDKYGYVKGFEIAGADKKFYYAKASIENNNVVIYSEKVKVPAAVRFGWVGDATDCNLYNKEGFPVSPFRTDNWKAITQDEKYKIEIINK